MQQYDIDLHIHSLHSIGVSKVMTIPKIAEGAKAKGLHVIGTGDATQPQWFSHLKQNLIQKGDVLEYDSVSFILSVEVEDTESIHHLVLLPDFEAIDELRSNLNSASPNLDDRWGGRPRVNLTGSELAGIVRDIGGMIGPAHAFTPYRSIFRENKHTTLATCYGDETPHIHFLELGLSADSTIADCIPELHRLTYITSSDAHSPSPSKLGREFVRFEMENPSFEELERAIKREGGRKPLLNVGLDPRLGKYYLSYCSKCRRTLIVETGNASPSYDDLNIYMYCVDQHEAKQLIVDINKRKVRCPVDGKLLRLGVRDRAAAIGIGFSKSPKHRPPYLRIAPLLDIITTALGVKSEASKSAMRLYDTLREKLGSETFILIGAKIEEIRIINNRLALMISAYRDGSARYESGGGGRYGKLLPPWGCETP
ncbi:phosphotransferase [Candidatus Thorarchaeota archaeon]|nr:MAG: phosphotransferase [Candidatus Thorarchaeota archaeon]